MINQKKVHNNDKPKKNQIKNSINKYEKNAYCQKCKVVLVQTLAYL